MRVLNVNQILDPVRGGGTAERTIQISRFMARAGVDCSVLTTNAGLNDSVMERLAGIQLKVLPCISYRFFVPAYRAKQIDDLVRSADIIHIMNHWTVLNVLVSRTAQRFGKPYVVCPAGALPIYGRSKILKYFYNLAAGRSLILQAAGQVAISRNELPSFQRYGVQANGVTVIPNGIDPGDFEAADNKGFRARHGLADDPFILFVGRLNHIKGPDLLLQAFLEAKDALSRYQLVFVGPDGGMLGKLKSMAHSAGISARLHFLGYLGGKEKSEAYHAASLLSIPSRQEAMSIVALEAGACATPVLLTDRCGFDETEAVGGGKVVPATVVGLRDGLVELLSDAARLKTMGERLNLFVAREFTWDAIVGKILAFYREILSGKT